MARLSAQLLEGCASRLGPEHQLVSIAGLLVEALGAHALVADLKRMPDPEVRCV